MLGSLFMRMMRLVGHSQFGDRDAAALSRTAAELKRRPACSSLHGASCNRPNLFPAPSAIQIPACLLINRSDSHIAGLAGLLHLHWWLPGDQQDFCPPDGTIVFELQVKSSGDYWSASFSPYRPLTSCSAHA
jgi:hypothetical protein